jgi:hypothetical protein
MRMYHRQSPQVRAIALRNAVIRAIDFIRLLLVGASRAFRASGRAARRALSSE